MRNSSLLKLACPLLALLSVLLVAQPSRAASVIKHPGDHPDYVVEFEPHGVFAWDEGHAPWNDDGFGLGARVNVSLMDNGPITKINNNMAIGFGLDYLFFNDICDGRWWWNGRFRNGFPVGPNYDCNGHALWFPVVLQWNFWLTDVISVFGEPGLAINHWWWEVDCSDPTFPDCNWDDSDTDVEFVFWGGARFMFGDTVGLTVRLGWPYLSVGASFLF